ncbi:hypothetical protein BCAR13_160017 [Paraburkholderia caribensis]|nr:hypothetical protein BCAR13_160017 [Paraburkholderia caribensis]
MRKLQKPVIHGFRIEHRDHETRPAVEKSTPQEIGSHERPGASCDGLAEAAALTCRMPLLRACRRIRVELAQHRLEVFVRVVHQLAFQPLRGRIEHEPLVHEVVREARGAAFEEARNPVGIPAAVAHPMSAEGGQAVDCIDIGGGRGEHARNRHGQFRRDDLVGVDRQHPGRAERIQRAVLLRAEAGPVGVCQHARAVCAGDLDGAVGAAAVDDDDLVGECDGAQAFVEAERGVLRDERDAECGLCHANGCRERRRTVRPACCRGTVAQRKLRKYIHSGAQRDGGPRRAPARGERAPQPVSPAPRRENLQTRGFPII